MSHRKTLKYIITALFFPLCLAHAADEKKKDLTPETKIQFDSINVPVVRYNEVIGYVYIKFEMETVNHEILRVLERIKPRFRDAVLRNLYGYFAITWKANEPVDVLGMRQYISEICNEVAGPDMLKRVKLTLVYSTPMKNRKDRPRVIKSS